MRDEEYYRDLAEQEAEQAHRQAEQAELAAREMADSAAEMAYQRDMALARAEKAEDRLARIEAILAPAVAALRGATKGEWDVVTSGATKGEWDVVTSGAIIGKAERYNIATTYRYADAAGDGSDNARAIAACVNAVRKVKEAR